MSSGDCVTCEKRKRKCDRTRSSAGCRRCAQARIECGGYPTTVSSKIPRPKHNSRGVQPQAGTTRHGRSENINDDKITSFVGPPIPNQPSESPESNSAAPLSNDRGHDLDFLDRPFGGFIHQQTANLHSQATIHGQFSSHPLAIPTPISTQNPTLAVQIPTPVDNQAPRVRPGGPMTAGQASLFDALFSLANDSPTTLPYSPESTVPGLAHELSLGECGASIMRRASSGSDSQMELATNQSENFEGSDDEASNKLLLGLLDELVLDRKVESNMVPFVVQSFMMWIGRFIFESTRSISFARDTIIRGHSLGDDIRQTTILVANAALAVSKSTYYEFTHYTALYSHLVKGALEAQACNELTREAAMVAMEYFPQLISLTCKMGPLANVLNLVDLYAPIFRRACPESNGFVNLAQRLAAVQVNLKYYVSFDILLSVITHRPMLFRYDLNFLSQQDEESLNEDDGPGMRWSIGIPARLVFAFARINTLMENLGDCIDQEVLRDLKGEIGSCKPIISYSPGDDPALTVGKLMVQESWKLAGYIYLYMGLCRANSDDAQVVQIQKRFMELLETIKPRRYPDLFLILPILIVGIATSSADRFVLRARLWGVSECSKPGTMGNDVIRILNDIWVHAVERPSVWLDLRTACLRIVGM
ncbi:unnamed protein product [Rhizoctonia solani]|uniref:Zn(2)-C6 fungal-type domain-containing protein n=1 Tax=Rhizoctonia solani TaxID=456999 RepID=A0A8H3CAG9_9AGAM|nr:unnamed protein product [Rhizoctonia solani]